MDRVLSFDMGGTTAKACVIDRGEPLLAREFEVARAYRFKKGWGLPIRVPVVELIEIGAGGGSIARVDRWACSRSARTAPGRIRARPATGWAAASPPSPTPTCSWVISTPSSSWAAACGSTWRPPGEPSRSAWPGRWASS